MWRDDVFRALARTSGLRDVPPAMVERVARRRAAELGLSGPEEYPERLSRDPGEYRILLEAVVVPETWFFRHPESFRFLREEALRRRPFHGPDNPWRLLSLPCSTGEEPYSMAMLLMTVSPDDWFRVDAVDISRRALDAAEAACYPVTSFREGPAEGGPFPETAVFLRTENTARVVIPEVKRRVRLLESSVLELDEDFFAAPYNVIFFRNLLIYFDDDAQARAARAMDRALAPEGLLFLGYAESRQIFFPRYESVGETRAYVSRKTETRKQPAVPVTPPPLHLPNRVPVPVAAQSPPPPVPPRPLAPARPASGASAPEGTLEQAWTLADNGRLAEAEAICRQVLGRQKEDAGAHYLMGVISLARGDEDAAITALERALYLDPRHEGALAQMGLLLETRAPDRAALYRNRLTRSRIET